MFPGIFEKVVVHLLHMWEDGGSDATYAAILVNSLKVCIHLFFFFNHL